MINLKIGIFGGTFDPPHKGHSTAAKAAVVALDLDRLLVIPDAQPPHKKLPEDAPKAEVRLELTGLAMAGVRKAEVSDIEIDRGGRSYTVDTVRQIRQLYPKAELYLLLGTDMFFCFDSWKDFREILDMVTLAVFARRDGEEEQLHRFADELHRKYGAKVKVVPNDAVEISSTDLRSLLHLRRGREYLDEAVYSAIIKKRLYGAKPEFKWLRHKAYEMLTSVKSRARERLRDRGGLPFQALGGRIRNGRVKRQYSMISPRRRICPSQLQLCKKYGIIPDDVEATEGKLLHSKTGAAIAKYEFGCDDQVYGAICWHTTGRPGMTLLEKVIYMADYIEPTRDFEGVEELRRLAYDDLDRALQKGFEMSVEEMEVRGIVPHPNTLKALDWIREEIKERDKLKLFGSNNHSRHSQSGTGYGRNTVERRSTGRNRKRRKSRKGIRILIIILAVILALALAAVAYWFNRSKAAKCGNGNERWHRWTAVNGRFN